MLDKKANILLGIVGINLLILCVKTLVDTYKFHGYVCEKCGQPYHQCEHSSSEDYTLVKRE